MLLNIALYMSCKGVHSDTEAPTDEVGIFHPIKLLLAIQGEKVEY